VHLVSTFGSAVISARAELSAGVGRPYLQRAHEALERRRGAVQHGEGGRARRRLEHLRHAARPGGAQLRGEVRGHHVRRGEAAQVRPRVAQRQVHVHQRLAYSDAKVANRDLWDFGWEIAHAAVTRRPPISRYTMVPRTGGYACDVGVWDLPSFKDHFLWRSARYTSTSAWAGLGATSECQHAR
jgi:hypothetical protein